MSVASGLAQAFCPHEGQVNLVFDRALLSWRSGASDCQLSRNPVASNAFAAWGSRRYWRHAQHDMTPIISSTGSSQVLCVSLQTTMFFRVISQHDREGSEVSFHARHERALFSREDEKDQK